MHISQTSPRPPVRISSADRVEDNDEQKAVCYKCTYKPSLLDSCRSVTEYERCSNDKVQNNTVGITEVTKVITRGHSTTIPPFNEPKDFLFT